MNAIRSADEKQGGRLRSEPSFQNFKNFIDEMEMAELNFTGRSWTWANNQEEEGFVEERLDHFFLHLWIGFWKTLKQ